MADLLVYVDPEHLDEVLGQGTRTLGRRVPVSRATLPPQIERLDELSTLFLVTVERGRALIVASLDDPRTGEIVGEATIHDHDITDLLVRLGCEKVWRVPAWASTPRIVPPNDVTLLRYVLGLPIADDLPADSYAAPPQPAPTRPSQASIPPPTGPAAHELLDDDHAMSLRLAVFANPASDVPRRAYAAYLTENGDPRGELIDLQLTRVEQGTPLTDRERELVARYGDACVAPLRSLLQRYELRRGFLWSCQIAPNMGIADGFLDSRAWSTLEDIASNDDRLLASRYVQARRARLSSHALSGLAHHDGLLSYETFLPYPDPASRGIPLSPIDGRIWGIFLDGGAFMRLRALCIDATRLAGRMPQLLHSHLGRRLAHLDAWIDVATARSWRTEFDAVELPLLTLRFEAHGIAPVVAFERTDGAHRMRVELRATVSKEIAADLARLIASLGAGIDELDIVDTSLAPFPAQQPELIAELGKTFSRVELVRSESLALI